MSGIAIGDTVSGYRIDAVAGRGGMGVVYRATQLRLDRRVAFKVIAPDLAMDADYRARFQREARLAASIDHPNIVPVYEANELDTGELYLVMRWVEGSDLRELLRVEHRITSGHAVGLVARVAMALDAAHSHGLVHRDVKPANVLIARGGEGRAEQVYLTDFGIARASAENLTVTRTGVFVGSLAYAAPELIEGQRSEPSADIYALGCVLFEALTGHPPFSRESELATMQAHLHDPIPSVREDVPDVPGELDEVVQVALAKRPTERFAVARDMAVAMERAVSEGSTARTARELRVPAASRDDAATGGGAIVTAPSRRSPRRGLAIAVGALAVGALVALAIAVTTPGGPRMSTDSTSRGPISGGGRPKLRIVSLGELPDPPGAIAIVDGSGAGVAAPANDQIAIVYRSGRPPATIPVGREPSALATDRSGRVWVADSGSADVRVIDPAAARTVARVRVGAMPSAIAVGGGDVWVAERRSNHVRAIDLKTRRPTRLSIATGGRGPVAIAYAPNGTVWVANRTSSDVTAIRDGRAAPPVYVSGGPVSISADMTGAWIGTSDGRVVRLSTSGQLVGQPIDLHSGPVMVALVGSDLWALSRDDATLSWIPAGGVGAPKVGERIPFGSAERPTALSCAPHLCVAPDPVTHQVLAASF